MAKSEAVSLYHGTTEDPPTLLDLNLHVWFANKAVRTLMVRLDPSGSSLLHLHPAGSLCKATGDDLARRQGVADVLLSRVADRGYGRQADDDGCSVRPRKKNEARVISIAGNIMQMEKQKGPNTCCKKGNESGCHDALLIGTLVWDVLNIVRTKRGRGGADRGETAGKAGVRRCGRRPQSEDPRAAVIGGLSAVPAAQRRGRAEEPNASARRRFSVDLGKTAG